MVSFKYSHIGNGSVGFNSGELTILRREGPSHSNTERTSFMSQGKNLEARIKQITLMLLTYRYLSLSSSTTHNNLAKVATFREGTKLP